MTASTRRTVLSLYMRVFRIARTWQSVVPSDAEAERKYILQEARTLFRQNQQLTDQESIKKCIEECEARIEIGKRGEMPNVYITGTHIQGLKKQESHLLFSTCGAIHFKQRGATGANSENDSGRNEAAVLIPQCATSFLNFYIKPVPYSR
ncbi:hypothetical protein L3Q82_010696 [Scortum barcoo]|uniref:Uncharacterized protein n=1 Tax=Scortum barcoo TaxID=214431 RepID=A0ACB8WCT4_9TELE|nr:hypothetical protein L3Q82_010696 [Scortum barcoo]